MLSRYCADLTKQDVTIIFFLKLAYGCPPKFVFIGAIADRFYGNNDDEGERQ